MIDAVEFLHSKGWVHRDIKPKNILLKSELDEGVVRRVCKLSDFGISSKYINSKGQVIKFGGVIGTEPFIAPEIFDLWAYPKTADKYDARLTDIWALGVVLYNMVTAMYPFNYHDRKVMLDYQKSRTIAFKKNRSTETGKLPLSSDVTDLIKNMLDPDPKTRLTFEGIRQHPWIRHSSQQNKLRKVIKGAQYEVRPE
jgi:serine/threonine protein kinase